jgi:hypothetical protein
MLTHIVHEKPEDVKKFMVQLLKKAKKDENGHCRLLSDFIKKDDYDAMFDSYDILNLKAIPFCYLLQGKFLFCFCLILHQALEVIGVPDPEFVMEQKYPEVKPDSTIGKKQFVTILSREQRRYGYSFTVE